MLESLYIKNYALIDEIKVNFGQGLNIITGETGSGKSIILGALGLVLGDRSDTSIIQKNQDKCIIEAQFNIENHFKVLFEQHELDFDKQCILRREINSQGKSRSFINDTPVNLSVLKEIGSYLIDMVSQHETLELNHNRFQLETIDAAANHQELLSSYINQYHDLKNLEKKLSNIQEKEAVLKSEQDYILFLLNEFNDAQLKAGEEIELEQQLSTLEHAETILAESYQITQLLKDSDYNIIDSLKDVLNKIMQLSKVHQDYQSIYNRVKSVMIELEDLSQEVDHSASKIHANPEKQEEVKTRLDLINHLMNKHRAKTTEELLYIQHELEKKNHDIGSLEIEISDLENQIHLLQSNLYKLAKDLSVNRIKASKHAEIQINELMKSAGLQNAIFKIDMITSEELSQSGLDNISFLFAANKGSNFLPLSKTASGGELGRLMLCIKSYIADRTNLPTMIFDEIDTGISGETAIKIGALMKQLSNNHQVFAVTHLPQIAAKAHHHYKVYKSENDQNTHTYLSVLEGQDRIVEIANMLGGEKYTEKTLEAAKELLAL